MYATTAKRRTTRDNIIDWRFWPRSAPSCPSATINNDTLLFLSLPTEIPQSHTAWSKGNGPEPVSVEDVVDVWRYGILSCMPEITTTTNIYEKLHKAAGTSSGRPGVQSDPERPSLSRRCYSTEEVRWGTSAAGRDCDRSRTILQISDTCCKWSPQCSFFTTKTVALLYSHMGHYNSAKSAQCFLTK